MVAIHQKASVFGTTQNQQNCELLGMPGGANTEINSKKRLNLLDLC